MRSQQYCFDDALFRVSESMVWHDVNLRYSSSHIPFYRCCWKNEWYDFRVYVKILIEQLYWRRPVQLPNVNALDNIYINYGTSMDIGDSGFEDSQAEELETEII